VFLLGKNDCKQKAQQSIALFALKTFQMLCKQDTYISCRCKRQEGEYLQQAVYFPVAW